MAGHKYSTKFKKNINLPYAKVGRQVFRSLYDAETYCAENGLDPDTAFYGTQKIVREESETERRANELIKVLKFIIRSTGFELIERVKIRDTRIGKEFR